MQMCRTIAVGLLLLLPGAAWAQPAGTPPELEGVGVEEHLDAQVPLDATFTNHRGERVKLSELLDGKRPVLLNLMYHSCPVLCSMVFEATVDSLQNVPWTVGKEFDVISLSIDPRDTPESASKKREEVLAEYEHSEAKRGWHFLVGEEPEIKKVAQAVGFKYRYDERQEQYAHPAAIMLLKPSGEVARYLYGLEYSPKDVRVGLLEAADGNSVSTVEQVILYCYQYDPKGSEYVLVAWRVMRIGGLVTVILLGGFLFLMWRRELRKRRRKQAGDDASHPTAHAPAHSSSSS